MEALQVGKFHGVGPATEAKMNRLGIHTGLDLRAKSLEFLIEHFGKAGPYFYGIARGIDERSVRPNRIRKSVGAENTFPQDLVRFEDMQAALAPTVDKVWGFCERTGTRGRTVTLKVKYADFEQITRSRSFVSQVPSRDALSQASLELLRPLIPAPKGIRLLGGRCRRSDPKSMSKPLKCSSICEAG